MSIKWQIETFDLLPSTMDVARQRGEAGALEGTVVVARNQTAGIGRQGNHWISKPGNLFASIILRSIDLKNAGQYSYVAAVALAEAVIPNLKAGFIYQSKWPNDGFLNDRKFCGLLPHLGKTGEDGKDFLNLGIGVNIDNAPDDKNFLNQGLERRTTADQFLEYYLQSLDNNIQLYRRQGFAPIRKKWLDNAKGIGEGLTVRLPNEVFKGFFSDIDVNGALIVGLETGGQRVIRSGEVFFGNEI